MRVGRGVASSVPAELAVEEPGTPTVVVGGPKSMRPLVVGTPCSTCQRRSSSGCVFMCLTNTTTNAAMPIDVRVSTSTSRHRRWLYHGTGAGGPSSSLSSV